MKARKAPMPENDIVPGMRFYYPLHPEPYSGMPNSQIHCKSENHRMKNLLMSDLDHTLIYSSLVGLGSNPLEVEYKEGQVKAYMSRSSAELFLQLTDKISIVPLTSRSKEQYERIQFPNGWKPPLALVANGGILLRDGLLDDAWYRETLRQISPAKEALCLGSEYLKRDSDLVFEIRLVDGLFLFTKSSHPESTKARLLDALDTQVVDVYTQSSKVYVFPKALLKGKAVKRFRELVPESRLFCAGDSPIDLSMLEEADCAFAPKQLVTDAHFSHKNLFVAEEGKLFSDVFLTQLSQRIAP